MTLFHYRDRFANLSEWYSIYESSWLSRDHLSMKAIFLMVTISFILTHLVYVSVCVCVRTFACPSCVFRFFLWNKEHAMTKRYTTNYYGIVGKLVTVCHKKSCTISINSCSIFSLSFSLIFYRWLLGYRGTLGS